MNKVWSFCILTALLYSFTAFILGQSVSFNTILNSLFDMASLAVDVSIGLIGLMVLWMGFIRIAEKAGGILWLAKLFSPLLCKLMEL